MCLLYLKLRAVIRDVRCLRMPLENSNNITGIWNWSMTESHRIRKETVMGCKLSLDYFICMEYNPAKYAGVVELVDAVDSKSTGA